jgi:hypothetical protein
LLKIHVFLDQDNESFLENAVAKESNGTQNPVGSPASLLPFLHPAYFAVCETFFLPYSKGDDI